MDYNYFESMPVSISFLVVWAIFLSLKGVHHLDKTRKSHPYWHFFLLFAAIKPIVVITFK
jgi:hypothetical protein